MRWMKLTATFQRQMENTPALLYPVSGYAARQGRKEALGLFLITQDPQDIDDTVFKQVNTKMILNLNNDAAITSLKVPKEYERRIPYLKKGQMIIHSPDNSDIVEIVGLSNCVVRHR